MSILKLIGFVGETPKIIPRLLGDMASQLASNVRLDDGGLTPRQVVGARVEELDVTFPEGVPLGADDDPAGDGGAGERVHAG